MFSKILLSRIIDYDRTYCVNINDRERERIKNRFLTKFGFQYLYYFQIDSRLKPLLKPYALRSIRNIRSATRPYLDKVKQITSELRNDLTLEQYKTYYLEHYEVFVKKYFVRLFEDRYDTEGLEGYKEFLVSLKQVSLRDFCDNLFEVKKNLRYNNLYYHLFNRVHGFQMQYRTEDYKKAYSLLLKLQKEKEYLVRGTSLIEKNVQKMDPLFLEKKFIKLDLDTQFIKEFSDFIPSAFWNIPGYSHFELMAKAVKDNVEQPEFLKLFENFISRYKSLRRLIEDYSEEELEELEEPDENFYHNIQIKKFYIAVLQELGWNEEQIDEFLKKSEEIQDDMILNILFLQKRLSQFLNSLIKRIETVQIKRPILSKVRPVTPKKTPIKITERPDLIKRPEKKPKIEIPAMISPSDLVIDIPFKPVLQQQELEFKLYHSDKLKMLNISTDNFSHTKLIGVWGENYIYNLLLEEYKDNDNIEIIWNNKFGESGEPYDILFKRDNEHIFIEVKTTITSVKKFTISGDEFNLSKEKRNSYWLYVVINAGTENSMYMKIENLYQLYQSNMFKLSSITLAF